MKRILLIHQHDPNIHHVGGVGTFINTFFKYMPADFEADLIGVTADPVRRPVGVWQHFTAGKRSFRYLPIVDAHPTYHSRFPLTLRFALALIKHRAKIDFRDALLEYHRVETDLPLCDLKNARVVFFHTHTKDIYNPKTEIIWKKCPWLYFMIEKHLLKHMDQLYSVREDTVQWYRERYPDLHQPFQFLPTWMDEEIFQSWPEEERRRLKNELAAKHELNPADPWLLFVGRFELQKDPVLLFDSFKELLKREPNARLIMIGGGSMEESLRRHAMNARMADNIKFLSPQPQSEIAQWMNASQALVLTSAYEGMPRVVMEAFRCGLAAVAFDDGGGILKVMRSPAVGRIVRERMSVAFATAFEDVLKQKPDRLACQASVADYSASNILSGLFENYRKLLKAHGIV